MAANGASDSTHIVILGGGFGGVSTAQRLSKALGKTARAEITLINRDNHFVFVPMLTSAAAGSIETLHVVTPLRELIPRVQFRAEEITGIDLTARRVSTVSRTTGQERGVEYDHLVIALGNVVDLNCIPGAAQHGMLVKTLGDAIAIRNHVIQMLEAADIETDPATRRSMLTFVVVGGGFSGVEMVGELNDMVRDAISRYPSIAKEQVRVILLHSGDRILPEMPPDLADYALKQLRKRGVEVRLGVRLEAATQREAVLQGGTNIATRTLVVAVGNAPPPVLADLEIEKQRGKIVVDEFMRVPGYDGVWALGDNAIVPNGAAKDGAPSPPTAQFATRQGKVLANNIVASMRDGGLKPFSYNSQGQLCLVGHGSGVGQIPLGLKVRGVIGWFLWRSVYWAKMPSAGRKLKIGFDWFFDLFLMRDTAEISLARTQTITRAHFQPGEYIIRQGDPGDHFYVVVDGQVEVLRERSSGATETLATLGPGESFGETALITNRRRNASVRCLTSVDVVVMSRDDFAVLTSTWSQFGDQMSATADSRLAQAPPTQFLTIHQADIRAALAARSAASNGGSHPVGESHTIGFLRRADGSEIELRQDLVTLGRSPENNIVVNEAVVSRRHALLQREDDDWWIEDLGGQNGTYVNDTRVNDRIIISPGDRIRIGASVLTFGEREQRPSTNRVTIVTPEPQPEPSITQLIRGLDNVASTLGPPATTDETPAVASVEPAPGPITSMIHALDGREAVSAQPVQTPTEVSPTMTLAVSDANGERRIDVDNSGATIGRAAENTIRIEDERVSRVHARIDMTGDGFFLVHLSATNATLVNDAPIDMPRKLHAGDTIILGGVQMRVEQIER